MLEVSEMMRPIITEECGENVSSTSPEHQTKDEPSSSIVDVKSVIGEKCREREASTSKENGSSKQTPGDDVKLYQVHPGTPDCIIDVMNGTQTVKGENHGAEKICRICHLSSEDISGSSVVIKLGCACKGDMGTSHRRCAEIWFKHRKSRICEICGKMAKNIKAIQTITNTTSIEARALRIRQDGSHMIGSTTYLPDTEGSCGCRNSFCNILLICILLAFVLPWLYRMDL